MGEIENTSETELLESFFTEHGIASYIEEFKKQKVFSFDTLHELTNEDLQALGVETLGDRKSLLKLFSGNELSNFKNEILYKNASKDELEALDIKENEILKKNPFRFKYSNSDYENGELTLYLNRIVWKGDLNDFTIGIIDITDVSVKNEYGKSTLIITVNDEIYNFTLQNSEVGKNVALAALSGMHNQTSLVGVAMLHDKPISDIEFWRQKIEALREEQKKSVNTFGVSHECPKIRTSYENQSLTCILVSLALFGIILIFAWGVQSSSF